MNGTKLVAIISDAASTGKKSWYFKLVPHQLRYVQEWMSAKNYEIGEIPR